MIEPDKPQDKQPRGKFWLIAAASILGVVAIGIIICLSSGLIQFTREVDDRPQPETPGEFALRHTEDFLAAIQDRPGQQKPDNLFWDMSNPSCWDLLQPIMATNANRYSLTAVNGLDKMTPAAAIYSPDEFGDVTIHAEFPDGTLIEMYYYNDRLETCYEQESPDDRTPLSMPSAQ